MCDSFLVRSDSLKNDVADGKIIGFQFGVRVANYRGVLLSLCSGFLVRADGVEYPESDLTLGVNGKPPRTLDEIAKAHFEHWDLQHEGTIHVKKDGGLAPGKHIVEYLPVTLYGYGYRAMDEEWVTNPPKPGDFGGGKTHSVCRFELDLQKV